MKLVCITYVTPLTVKVKLITLKSFGVESRFLIALIASFGLILETNIFAASSTNYGTHTKTKQKSINKLMFNQKNVNNVRLYEAFLQTLRRFRWLYRIFQCSMPNPRTPIFHLLLVLFNKITNKNTSWTMKRHVPMNSMSTFLMSITNFQK